MRHSSFLLLVTCARQCALFIFIQYELAVVFVLSKTFIFLHVCSHQVDCRWVRPLENVANCLKSVCSVGLAVATCSCSFHANSWKNLWWWTNEAVPSNTHIWGLIFADFVVIGTILKTDLKGPAFWSRDPERHGCFASSLGSGDYVGRKNQIWTTNFRCLRAIGRQEVRSSLRLAQEM